MSLEVTWTMLGNGEAKYEELWSSLARGYPDRVAAHIGFDERLAHHIEAGADAFLMPSRFEPCGLNPMYSLRYGTVPIGAPPAGWRTRSRITIPPPAAGPDSNSGTTRRLPSSKR